jgi:beta-glucosidase
VTIAADPRLLARFEGGRWVIDSGEHRVAVGASAEALALEAPVELTGRTFGA